MSELNERILEAVQMSKIDDYGQRSALGMARTFLENNKPIKRDANSLDRYVGRDDLAEELVRILQDERATKAEGIDALAAAREVVNAPFINPDMNGQKFKGEILKHKHRDA